MPEPAPVQPSVSSAVPDPNTNLGGGVSPATSGVATPLAGSSPVLNNQSVPPSTEFTKLEDLAPQPIAAQFNTIVAEAQTAEDLLAAAGLGQKSDTTDDKPIVVSIPPTPVLKISSQQTQSSASMDGIDSVQVVNQTDQADSQLNTNLTSKTESLNGVESEDLNSVVSQLEQQIASVDSVTEAEVSPVAVVKPQAAPQPSSQTSAPNTPQVTSTGIEALPPVEKYSPAAPLASSVTSTQPVAATQPVTQQTESPKPDSTAVEPSAGTQVNEVQSASGVTPDQAVASLTPTQPPSTNTPPVVATKPSTQDDELSESNGEEYQSLLDLLVGKKYVTDQVANKISVENISTGLSVEEIIERDKLLDVVELTKAKAEFHRIPYVNLKDVGIFPEALNKIPESVSRRYLLLPFKFEPESNELAVAMVNPLDLTAINFVEQKTGVNIKVYYAVPSEVERLIAEYYSHSLSSEVTAALEQTKQLNEVKEQKKDGPAMSGETIRQAPITKIVQTVVSFAMKARASDIHIEPLEDRTRVRYRIDGILMEKLILPASVHDAVVSRIKILSGLKIDEKRVPQDGRFNFHSDSEEVDLRVSTLPTVHGEKIVMRLLKKDAKVPELPELGLNGLALKNLKDAMQVPHGIILVTGPTGSGKTTTLYSVLDKLNTPKVNIMTLEDPVEYQMMGVNQVQINPQAGLTFASGLRSFLRQDPNIIMVGEIRDTETAELAVQASLTGHLVFSTLHTSSAAGALPRLLDMGAEPFLLASSMTLIMAQRVMRVLNPEYKEPYKPDKVVLDDIKAALGPHYDMWLQKKNIKEEDIQLYRAKADRPHTEPEYRGRVAIFEVLRITEDIGKMILQRLPATDIEKAGQKNGMLLMKQDGFLKVLEGLSTPEEVLRVAQV